jgi:glutamate--cysteine ligase
LSAALQAVRSAIALATSGAKRPSEGPLIGIEVEFLALDAVTNQVVSLEDRVVPALEPIAKASRWSMARTAKGVPRYELPGGGSIAFEPGGQVEYASPPARSPAELLGEVRRVQPALCSALAQNGIRLVGAGIDPFNAVEDVPLQIQADRYRLMQDYFGSIGPAGVRMMRQTASIQISVDASGDRLRTWKVLNAMAPYLVATFANSSQYAGGATGWASYRSCTWQSLDPTRTGIVWDGADPVDAYTRFALDAPAMLVRSSEDEYLPLRTWVARDAASEEFVATHLTTLFPEIRPRGYFEVRSVDALPPAWLPVPVLMVAGIVMDERALADADAVLGDPQPGLLRNAATAGLRDPAIASVARDLADIALRGCAWLGSRVAGADAEVAREYFDCTVRRGRNIDAAAQNPVPTAA